MFSCGNSYAPPANSSIHFRMQSCQRETCNRLITQRHTKCVRMERELKQPAAPVSPTNPARKAVELFGFEKQVGGKRVDPFVRAGGRDRNRSTQRAAHFWGFHRRSAAAADGTGWKRNDLLH